MSAIGDFVKGVVNDVLQDMLKQGVGQQARQAAQAHATTLTAAERLRPLERMIKPAKRQTSRKQHGAATRSKAKRRAY